MTFTPPANHPSNRLPVADYNVSYRSSRQPELVLSTDVFFPPHPSPVLLTFHNWHGGRHSFRPLAELLAHDYVVVNVSMRGRDDCKATPDVNGWELLDAVDAVRYVKQTYAPYVSNPDVTFCLGFGGGGGNVYAAMAKFPTFFNAGVALCGVSDYALWFKGNVSGEFRDEMLPWIGCDPYENLDAYKSRSGLHLMQNLQAPLLVIHGEEDEVIPVSMARLYQRLATELGKKVECLEVPYAGHHLKLSRYLPAIHEFFSRNKQPVVMPRAGLWRIGGYLQTSCQRLELPSLDGVTDVRYELDEQGMVTSVTDATGAPATNPPSAPLSIVPS